MQHEAPVRIGQYTLHGVLGAGGTSTVHFGVLEGPAGFARTVAIKRLYPHFARDRKLVDEFLGEARLVTRIRHPNVVPTLDVVVDGEECLVVMEYVPGETLARLLQVACQKPEPPPASIACAIMIDVLRGLHAAHEARDTQGVPLGVVHRDVSPQNVLVGVDGFTRILDFGIAKVVGQSSMTPRDQMKGKLSYMAPEQQGGARVTPRTDVFATSIVLWEALVGRRLFLDETEAKTLENTLSMPIAAPSEFAPGIPPELDRVMLRGLERDPDRRFQTAKEMSEALTHALRPATALEVAAWVEELAHDALAHRSEMVHAVEGPRENTAVHTAPAILVAADAASAPTAPDVSTSVSAVEPPRAPDRSRAFLYFAFAIAALSLGALELVIRKSEGTQTQSSVQSSAPSSDSTIADPPENAVSALAPAPSTSDSASAVDSRAVRPHRSHLRLPKHGAGHCSPPFTIDSSGHKVYKPECF